MRRTIALILLLCAPAHAQVFDVTKYGATPGGPDCSPAIQAAVDAAGDWAAKYHRPATVRVPAASANYSLSEPIRLPSNVSLRGEGGASVLQTKGATAAILLGQKPLPADGTVRTRDLFGVADATLAPAPGAAFGYRVGRSYLAFPASPFELGPRGADGRYYSGTSVLTIDLLAYSDEWHYGFLCGTKARPSGDPEPWTLRYWEGTDQAWFDFALEDGVSRRVGVPCGGLRGTKGPLRLALQFDLDKGSVVAAVNGKYAAPDLSRLGRPWKPGLRFRPPFSTEFEAGSAPNPEAYGDFTLGALALSDGPRYSPGKPGTALARLDGREYADAATYAQWDSPVYACLRPSDSADTDGSVPYYSGIAGWVGSGHYQQAGFDCRTGESDVSGLAIQMQGAYGSGVEIGGLLNADLSRVRVEGGARGFSSILSGTSYPIRFTDCDTIYSRDCAFSLGFGLWRAYGCSTAHYGNQAVRCYNAGLVVRDFFDVGSSTSTNVIRSMQSNIQVNGWLSDYEVDDVPSECGIYIGEAVAFGGNSNVLRDVELGSGPPGVPYVLLDSAFGVQMKAQPTGSLILDNCFTSNVAPGKPIVGGDVGRWGVTGLYDGKGKGGKVTPNPVPLPAEDPPHQPVSD